MQDLDLSEQLSRRFGNHNSYTILAFGRMVLAEFTARTVLNYHGDIDHQEIHAVVDIR